jgi:hypothetical protein
MQSRRTIMLLATPLILLPALAARAETTTQQEALTVAQNYVSLILSKDGNWGGSPSATVASIEKFKRGERVLGYFCRVLPQGYIVVSLHKELAPVKAYSVDSNLDPELDQGMTDVAKILMERVLDAVEDDLGRPIDPADRFDALLETNYRPAWEVLADKGFDGSRYHQERKGRSVGMNYQEGEVLLSTAWHQHAPYNDQCPFPAHWDPNDGWVTYECDNTSNGRTVVGCVATAAAQIMRYWRWPPYGHESPYNDTYDWLNMCEAYWWDPNSLWWIDQNGNPVTQAQVDAVAELCHEIGIAVDMDYGCGGSSASTDDMEGVYEDYFRYDEGCYIEYRDDYSAYGWYELMMNQFNVNRPVQYKIEGHSVVADGWKMEQIGDEYYWYHMNYGWGGSVPNEPEWQGYSSSNTWFALDAHPGGDTDDYLVRTIYPDCAIGGWMEGDYDVPSPINARYIDQDTRGNSATFAAGIWFQALEPDFLIRGEGTGDEVVTFNGAPGAESIFYFSGDFDSYTRIHIADGAIRLRGGGEMVIH